MSSPKRRIETDVMKMLMSDYEVTLVNDNMQEFYVRFKGPDESRWKRYILTCRKIADHFPDSTIQRRNMEDPRRVTRSISLQKPEYWFRQQDLSS